MLKKGLFRNPKNELEGSGKRRKSVSDKKKAEGMKAQFVCPVCKENMAWNEFAENYFVCDCGYHYKMGARQRIDFIADTGTFRELYADLTSKDILSFPEYAEKLKRAQATSGEKEAVICATAKIAGIDCAVFTMEGDFMMGSMGSVVGEKITRLFEYADQNKLPVVGFTVSGGARMQEGIISLMQMAKTSGAVKKHGDNGGFYLCVLTNPTTGGVTASFAMEADIILAEPGALIGFAGPRVIEQTIRRKLPPGFQTAEFLLEKGFVDRIAPRSEQRELVGKILSLHEKRR